MQSARASGPRRSTSDSTPFFPTLQAAYWPRMSPITTSGMRTLREIIASSVERFLDDRRVRALEDCDLHLVGYRVQLVSHDLERYRIKLSAHHRLTLGRHPTRCSLSSCPLLQRMRCGRGTRRG